MPRLLKLFINRREEVDQHHVAAVREVERDRSAGVAPAPLVDEKVAPDNMPDECDALGVELEVRDELGRVELFGGVEHDL